MTTPTHVENPLKELARYGQSIWFDYIRRSLITSGELARLVEEDGLTGITSNPAIFEKAISGSNEYSDLLEELQRQNDLDTNASYEPLAVRDVLYVEELIGPDTINTIPPATFEAFRDHGEARPSLESGIEEAREVMKRLEAAGISMQEVTANLVKQGIKLFAEPFDKLLNILDPKCKLPLGPVNQMSYALTSGQTA